jgi:hypothetical protein
MPKPRRLDADRGTALWVEIGVSSEGQRRDCEAFEPVATTSQCFFDDEL